MERIPPPEEIKRSIHKLRREWPVHFYEIKSKQDLYEVSKNSNFFQNPEDFKLKKERWLYIEENLFEEKVKELIKSLAPQKIVLITGAPCVGKSTFCLAFLDRCLEEGFGDWRNIVLLNPEEEYLTKTLETDLIEWKLCRIEEAEEHTLEDIYKSTLLVVDGLYREGRKEPEKIFELFRKVKERGFRLIATIRTHELEDLKLHGSEWRKFENDITIELITPHVEIIKPVFVNLVKTYSIKFKQTRALSEDQLEKYLQSKEFEEIIKIVIDKSKGIVGYLTYLIKDLSRVGEISKIIVENYPRGLIELVKTIIERDFTLKHDEVLPTLILLLAEHKGYLSFEFIKSLIEWGNIELNKGRNLIPEILSRIEILLDTFAVKTKEAGIALYRFPSHWKGAIKDFSMSERKWSEARKHLAPRIKTFLHRKYDELRKGKLSPEPDNDAFVLVADIIKLLDDKNALREAQNFLKKYDKYEGTNQYLYLKKTLATLWIKLAEKELDEAMRDFPLVRTENFRQALEFIKYGLEIEPANGYLYFLASRSHRGVGDIEQALESCKKAVELDKDNAEYIEELGDILELRGKIARSATDYPAALISFSEAKKAYKRALEIIEELDPIERGARKNEESRLWWKIGTCNRRIIATEREFEYISWENMREELKNDFEKSFRAGVVYERKGDYEKALEEFENAKISILEYVDTIDLETEEGLLKETQELVGEVYKQKGFCYEKKEERDKASDCYLIFLDLNEYTSNSLEWYLKYASKFRGWGLYGKAIYCLQKALKVEKNDYFILSEMADLNGKIGNLHEELKFLKKAIETQKALSGVLMESDIDLLSNCEERIKTRKDIDDILGSLCDVADMAIGEAEPWKLSIALCRSGLLMGKINPVTLLDPIEKGNGRRVEEIRDELMNLGISCFCRAFLLNKKNHKAKYEVERLTQRPISEALNVYSNYYRRHINRKIQTPIDAFLRVYSQAIFTMISLHETRKKGLKRKVKILMNKLSGYWGWIGGQIIRMYRDEKRVNKISPEVAVKCFKLSLKLRERNRKSSNGLAWALFYAGRVDEAIQAFEHDLNEINKNNPASFTGIGRAYEEKGKYQIAAEYIKKGADLCFEFRFNEKPHKVIESLTRSAGRLENLAFLTDSPIDRLKLLEDTVKVYEMIEKILQQIKLEKKQMEETKLIWDDQNLFKFKILALKGYLKTLQNR